MRRKEAMRPVREREEREAARRASARAARRPSGT